MKPQPFPSFKRGITDFPIDAQGFARKLDNVLLDSVGKPYQRPGQFTWYTSGQTIPAATRIGSFFKYATSNGGFSLYAFAQNTVYVDDWSVSRAGQATGQNPTWFEVVDSLSQKFFSAGSANTRYSAWKWSNHLFVTVQSDIRIGQGGGETTGSKPRVIYRMPSNPTRTFRLAGLPVYGSDFGSANYYAPTVAASNVSATGGATVQDGAKSTGMNFVYLWYWSWSYVDADGTTHLVVGPVTQTVINTSSPSTSGPNILFKNLPWFAVGSESGYDRTLWTLNIARAEQASGIYYVIQTYTYAQWNALGTKQFNDTWRDSDGWFGKPASFFQGTFASPGETPGGAFGGVVNDTGYICSFKTLYQAWPGTVDLWPGSFGLAFEEMISGFAELDYPMVFLDTKVYRVEGTIDSAGNGAMLKRLVTSTTGCRSNQGIVRVGRELYFPGNDGFYVTDGWGARKISAHLDRSYAYLTQDSTCARAIRGDYVPDQNRIYWSMRDPSSVSGDNEIVWVLDLNQGLDPGGAFTTWSSAGQAGGWTATCFMGAPYRTVLRGDKGGFVWAHRDGVLSAQVDDSVGSTAAVRPVLPVVQTFAFAAGDQAKTKWADKVFVAMRHRGLGANTTARHQVAKERDLSGVWKAGSVLANAGLPLSVASEQILRYKSFLARGSSRFNVMTLQIAKAWVALSRSDDFCTATVAGGTVMTPTVANGFATIPFLTSLVGAGCKVAFAGDGYVAEFGISAAVGSQITLSGAASNVVGTKWVIRGYPFGEDFYYENLELATEVFEESNVLGHNYSMENKNS